jgi:hypothetical protein
MHPSTEDLLSVRDGEPLDARTSEVIAADARCAREVERLDGLRIALRKLPDLEAPTGAWERIAAIEHETRYRRPSWIKRAAGLGVAAAVAAAAIIYLGSPAAGSRGSSARGSSAGGSSTGGSSTLAAPEAARGPDDAHFAGPGGAPYGGRVVPASYTELVAESARLERMLGQLSYQRPLMSGATASTIVGLEDRIAFIDEQLTYSAARGLPQPERAALWGERVDLMNALVQVRYGQAQPTGF